MPESGNVIIAGAKIRTRPKVTKEGRPEDSGRFRREAQDQGIEIPSRVMALGSRLTYIDHSPMER